MLLQQTKYGEGVHLLRDRDAILRSRAMLDELAVRSGQPGARDDLDYRLEFSRFSPGAQSKRPCLLLIRRPAALAIPKMRCRASSAPFSCSSTPSLGSACASTPPRTPPGVAHSLLRRLTARGLPPMRAAPWWPGGAQAVVMTIQSDSWASSISPAIEAGMSGAPSGIAAEWSLTERNNPVYLALTETYDSTLATIGKKTRTQLRYYRRRAERDLSCTFIPEVRIGLDEFIAFNRQCMYPVPDEVARWRYEGRSRMERPFLQGLQDGNGEWLSIVGGRRQGDFTELEWQCNRTHLPASSLSTVIRAYLIEHEIALGMKRLYFEGGTPSSLRQSFVVECAADLTVLRKTAYSWFVRRFARALFPPKNQMAQILLDESLPWHPCRIPADGRPSAE